MTVTRDIFTGIATLIDGASLAKYKPTGSYATTDTGIVAKELRDGKGVPDRLVAIKVVPLTDDPSMPLGKVLLQLVGRGARATPLDVDDLMDPIFDLLHGRTGDVFGATSIIQMLRTSSLPMPEDANTRDIRVDKFYLDVDYAPTNLRPFGGAW